MNLLVEAAIVALLASNEDVSAIVADRIRPLALKQGDALPALVYQKISDVPDYVMGGQSGLTDARIQITCWAANDAGGYSQVKQLAEAVRCALSGYMGTVTSGADSLDIDFIELNNQTDLYDPEIARGWPVCAVQSDFMVTYRQEVPSWP